MSTRRTERRHQHSLKIARVLVRFDYVTSNIVTRITASCERLSKLRIVNCVADCVWLAVTQPTEWERIGDEIDAALVAARGAFGKSARIRLRCETTSIVLVAHTQVNLLGLCFSVKHSEPLSAALNPYTRAVICPRGVLPCEGAMHCNLVGYNRDLSFRECYFGIRERVVT